MYCQLASHKITIPKPSAATLVSCTWLNNNQILLFFANSNYLVYSLSQSITRLVDQGSLNTAASVIQCKRIAPNRCLLVTSQFSQMLVVDYRPQEALICQQIYLQQAQIFNSLVNNIQLVSFGPQVFVICNKVEDNRTLHFLTFTQKTEFENPAFPYKMSIFTMQLQLMTCPLFVKSLILGKQFAVVPQLRILQQEYQVKLISIIDQNAQKTIDLAEIAGKDDILLDLVEAQIDHYYVFIRHNNKTNKTQQLIVWGCRLHRNNNYYTQITDKLHTFNIDLNQFKEIVHVDYLRKIFFTSNYAHLKDQGIICDNYMEIRSLQNGQIFDRLYCNLKEIDFNPDSQLIIDYSQQINENNQVNFHLRIVIPKKTIYKNYVHKASLCKQNLSPFFSQMVIDLL